MYMLGFYARQYSSGMICTLSVLLVLMSTSTTAQLLGGSLVFRFRDTDAFWCFLLVSATFSPSMVNTNELCFVQCTPAACFCVKSTPRIKFLFKFWHTKNVCLHFFFPIFISHVISPIAPKLVPFAPTTHGMFLVLKSLSFSFRILKVSADMTLLVAPVSNNVFTVLSSILILNTVPFSDPKLSSIWHISVVSGMLVK